MNSMKSIKSILLVTFIVFSIILNAQEKVFEVKVIGKGEPILLFPGFTCTGDVWNDLVKELSGTYECHVFTFAGFGGVAPIEKPWLSKIKESIVDYIFEKRLNNATLIGHSLGGSLALWLATGEVKDFKKIIVVDALPSVGALMMPNFNSDNIVYNNPYSNQLLQMKADDFEKMAGQFASGMSLNKEKQTLIRKWIIESDRETYVHGYTDLLKLDLREDVSKIKTHVSILAATEPYGEENVKKTYNRQYRNLNDYSIIYAKNSAHFIMFDQPEWFINTIKTELE